MSGPSLQVDFPFSFLFLGKFFLEMGGEKGGERIKISREEKPVKGYPGMGRDPVTRAGRVAPSSVAPRLPGIDPHPRMGGTRILGLRI